MCRYVESLGASPALLPQVPIIFDTVDLQFLRDARVQQQQDREEAKAGAEAQQGGGSWDFSLLDARSISAWLDKQPAKSPVRQQR
jgi:hypothetical protein